MIDRCSVLRPEFVKENNVTCEKCKNVAFATFYDKDWDSHEYCKDCYPIACETHGKFQCSECAYTEELKEEIKKLREVIDRQHILIEQYEILIN